VISSALVVLVPPIDFFLQFAQPRPGNPDSQILFTISLSVFLIALKLELARVFWSQPSEEPA
jgi:hypothetical protein